MIGRRIAQYTETWESRGYPDGIPDEVPQALADELLAPSWKAIAVALLKNDAGLLSLGFSAPVSRYYMALKSIELGKRGTKVEAT